MLVIPLKCKDQGRGRLGRNSRPRDRNFALNGTQGEVEVSLNFFFFFFFFFKGDSFSFCHHTNASCDNILPLNVFLLPLNGNSSVMAKLLIN